MFPKFRINYLAYTISSKKFLNTLYNRKYTYSVEVNRGLVQTKEQVANVIRRTETIFCF